MSRIDIIQKTVAGQAATQLDVRIVSMPLYPTTSTVTNVFYGYYKANGKRVEDITAEGNSSIANAISPASKTALLNALNAAVPGVVEATLQIYQIGTNEYHIGYKKADGKFANITLTGTYFDAEITPIKTAVLSTAGATLSTSLWSKRKSFVVTSSGSKTDYPVTLTIYNITGTDSASTTYIGNNVRSDWGDLRVKTNSLVSLPFAKVKTNVDNIQITFSCSLADGSNTFYLYYGRSATDGSVTKFGVTTDQHYDSAETYAGRDQALAHMDNFKAEMIAYGPTAILEGGDKCGHVANTSVANLGFMQSVSDKHTATGTACNVPVYKWGWGNHDFEYTSFASLLTKYGAEQGLVSGTLYGYWEDAFYRYISLDSNYSPGTQNHLSVEHIGYGYVNTDQLTWLTSTLASSTKPCIILIHHPLGEFDTDRVFLTKETYHVQNRAAVRTILEASGKVVFCLHGHVHITAANVINGIPYLVCADLNVPPATTTTWDTPNVNTEGKWCKVEVDRDALVIRFIQQVQVSGVVQTVYNYTIPYHTSFDNDYGNNPEKVFASGYAAPFNKSSVCADASDIYTNSYTSQILKPANLIEDAALERTIKVYGLSTSPVGYSFFNFSPQTGKFRLKVNIRRPELTGNQYFKVINVTLATPAIFFTFASNGNIKCFNGIGSENTLQAYLINTWYSIDIKADAAAGTFDMYINDVLKASSYSFYSVNTTVKQVETVSETGNTYIDFLRIEKLDTTEPTVGTWSAEQIA